MAPRFELTRLHNSVWISGTIEDNRPHQHHAVQICWAADGQLAQLSYGEQTITAPTLIIEAKQPHALRLKNGVVCLLEQHSPRTRSLRQRWLDDKQVATAPRAHLAIKLDNASALLEQLTSPQPSPSPAGKTTDARVATILAWLDQLERDGDWRAASLHQALARAHLSEGRFLHLFSQQVGSPWRSYLVWRRALYALSLARQGGSLTEAAHKAGYADSAHLSRQFVKLFGFTPSAVLKNSQFVQAPKCGSG